MSSESNGSSSPTPPREAGAAVDVATANVKTKRRWTTPAVVGTLRAFEHAILACNGRPSGSLVCSATKGACRTVCTANS